MKYVKNNAASNPRIMVDAMMQTFSGAKIRKIDIFASLNVALFLIVCVFAYADRFAAYRGTSNLYEFVIYAVTILAGIFLLWKTFRYYDFDTVLLIVLQLGICLHFAGALISIDGLRLYDIYIAALRYDKYVHFVNAFTVTALVWTLVQNKIGTLSVVTSAAVVAIVLGLGAFVEIVEYGVVKTVERNGVGDYDNNMQDLLANLLGSTLGIVVLRWQSWLHNNRKSRRDPGDDVAE